MILGNIIKDHVTYKQQIFKLAKADLVKTYRGAALGWAWAIIKPAVTIFVYWFSFEIGLRAGKDVNGFPFFLWLISGVIPWFYMSDMLTAGTDTIRKYSYLVTKMKFPVSTIPTFVSISKFIVHLILMAIMIVIFICMGYPPTVYILQLPIYMILMFIFFTIWSLFASLLSSMSKDFGNLVKSMVTAVFWLSGILWNPDTIKIGWVKNILMINPVTFLSNGFRNCFINQVWIFEQPKRLLYFGIVTILLLLLTIWAYKKLRKEIPDVLI
ncbi:MAG: ABC transporter permease [Clostridia bacterium]|nr:ABC transporter permease [Clostridia bacterium]